MKRIKFSDTFSLSVQPINKTVKKPVVLPVNHIIIIDVSGSMYHDLVELRRHLKNKITTLVGVNDTVSIVWFSGKGEYGILQEAVPVRSLTDLSTLHAAIDKYLQAVGLTGFKEPIEEVLTLIDRLKAKSPQSLINFFFMSDGYDNQWSSKEILSVTKKLNEKVDNATFVEYGWNCNRDLLSKMAEVSGGNLIFSEHFENYRVVFEEGISRNITGGKKILVKLTDNASLGYAYSYDNSGRIVSYAVSENNEVLVPETLDSICYFSDGVSGNDLICHEVYIGLATLSQRMLANEIFSILAKTGDVYLVNRFVNAFSKQDYTDFQNECISQAFEPLFRFKEGIDFNAVPKEDAYTVLELLNDLSADDDNLIYPLHESFGYNRIGAGSKQRDESVKFEITNREMGVPISNIVFNASRPNASLQVRFNGEVTLPEGRSAYPKLPAKIPSFIYRNYTIVRDGIVHTRVLPVSLTEKTIEILQKHGLAKYAVAGQLYSLDISKLPVINRKMVKSVTAKETFTKVVELEELKARQKVLKFYRDQYTEKTSVGFSIIYGEDAATWLKEIGVTDYNGFNPPSDSVPLNDSYTAKELDITIKKISSLPSVKDVLAKIDGNKALTPRESLLEPAITEVRAFLNSPVAQNEATKSAVVNAWLDVESKNAIAKVRELNTELSKTKFAIVVGHVWFSDLPAGGDTLDVTVNGSTYTVTATLKEKEIGGKD